jgi:hypothetical protein
MADSGHKLATVDGKIIGFSSSIQSKGFRNQ